VVSELFVRDLGHTVIIYEGTMKVAFQSVAKKLPYQNRSIFRIARGVFIVAHCGDYCSIKTVPSGLVTLGYKLLMVIESLLSIKPLFL